MNGTTNNDLKKMEKDAISFYGISCGVDPNNFDILINCESAKEIWDVLKNLYQESEQAQDKKLNTALSEFTNLKALPSESLDDSIRDSTS